MACYCACLFFASRTQRRRTLPCQSTQVAAEGACSRTTMQPTQRSGREQSSKALASHEPTQRNRQWRDCEASASTSCGTSLNVKGPLGRAAPLTGWPPHQSCLHQLVQDVGQCDHAARNQPLVAHIHPAAAGAAQENSAHAGSHAACGACVQDTASTAQRQSFGCLSAAACPSTTLAPVQPVGDNLVQHLVQRGIRAAAAGRQARTGGGKPDGEQAGCRV
jgi:hypothetical protein